MDVSSFMVILVLFAVCLLPLAWLPGPKCAQGFNPISAKIILRRFDG
jgi:hypothetical protein